MTKTKFSPQHLAKIIQVDIPRNDYNLTDLEVRDQNGVEENTKITDRNFLQTASKIARTVGLSTVPAPNSNHMIMTCATVDYVEEYQYGLKIYFIKDFLYKQMIIRISNFKPNADY